MFTAELRTRLDPPNNELTEDEEENNPTPHCLNAFLPILFFILFVIILLFTGGNGPPKSGSGTELHHDEANFGENSIEIMYLGAVVASFFAAFLYRVQIRNGLDANGFFARFWRFPLRSCSSSLESFVQGFTHLTPTIIVLVLAWSIGSSIDELGASRYFASSLEGKISPYSLPSFIFFISCLVAFSTGSSWGTMALMYPICGPVAFALSRQVNSPELYYCSLAGILEGSVFGDHCSFISDTTIMCSMACQCSIPRHVKTQIPYALFVAMVSLSIGFGAIGAIPLPVTYLLGFAMIVLGVFLLGARPDRGDKMDLISSVYCACQVYLCKRQSNTIEVVQLLQRQQCAQNGIELPSSPSFPNQEQNGAGNFTDVNIL